MLPAHDYQHIIWDWNGTLFDDAWLCLDIINHMLQRRSLPALTPERYQTIFRFPVIDYYRQLGFDFAREPFEAISDEFIGAYEHRRGECQLREQALMILTGNVKAGLSQSILSASKQDLLQQAVAGFGIGEMFVKVLGIENHHAFGKLDIGRAWVREIDLDPTRILLIGDTAHDYEVAQAMGVDCVLLPSGHQSSARLEASGARVVESLASLF